MTIVGLSNRSFEAEELTGHLRWLIGKDGLPTLQQQWKITVYGADASIVSGEVEWRDLPVEKSE